MRDAEFGMRDAEFGTGHRIGDVEVMSSSGQAARLEDRAASTPGAHSQP